MSTHTPHPQYADAQRLMKLFRRWQLQRRDQGLPSSQAEAASRMGFGQSALSQYLRGDIPLNVSALRKFSDLLGVEPAKISPSLTAVMRDIASSIEAGAAEAPRRAETRQGEDSAPGGKTIVIYAPSGHLNRKRLQMTGEVLGRVIKEDGFFERHGIPQEQIVAVRASDDSNADFVVEGDICFFDLRKIEPTTGGMFLLEHPDGLRVRTMRRLLDGSWVLEARNPDKQRYPDEIVPPSQGGLLRLCGQFFYRQGG